MSTATFRNYVEDILDGLCATPAGRSSLPATMVTVVLELRSSGPSSTGWRVPWKIAGWGRAGR